MTRHFFIDENLSQSLSPLLAAIFRRERFKTASQAVLLATDDVDLFQELRARDFDCIITQDKMQLENPDERAGLRDAGLHWLGLPEMHLGGAAGLAAQAAMAGRAVATVLDEWAELPTAYHCSPLARDSIQLRQML